VDHLIFRTSWVYGAGGRNFLRTIMQRAADQAQLRIVDDQIGAPTWSRLIAETTALALHRDVARRRAGAFDSAVLHLTASGSTSWHGFASAIVAGARASGASLKCSEVVAIASSEYPAAAPRPANSRLSNERLEDRYGVEMPAWTRGLDLCLEDCLP
jgi:dTDP-4-dehydrorhamnose reductase